MGEVSSHDRKLYKSKVIKIKDNNEIEMIGSLDDFMKINKEVAHRI